MELYALLDLCQHPKPPTSRGISLPWSVQKWWELLLVPWKEELNSMDWLEGKSTGNHRFSHEICGLPVIFPSNLPWFFLANNTRSSWSCYHRFGSWISGAPAFRIMHSKYFSRGCRLILMDKRHATAPLDVALQPMASLRCHQTWLAGKSHRIIYRCFFQLKTLIYRVLWIFPLLCLMTPEASSSHPHIAAALPPASPVVEQNDLISITCVSTSHWGGKMPLQSGVLKNLVGQPSQPARICGFHASTNKWRGIEGGSAIKNNHGVSWSTKKKQRMKGTWSSTSTAVLR